VGIEEVLRRLAVTGEAPEDLELDYDDRHGLWGGDHLHVAGGTLSDAGAPPDPRVPSGARARPLSAADLRALASALVVLEVWRPIEAVVDPETGLPPPVVPDTSFASLRVRASGQSAVLHGILEGRLATARELLVAWARRIPG
jgi:hypothetical protein